MKIYAEMQLYNDDTEAGRVGVCAVNIFQLRMHGHLTVVAMTLYVHAIQRMQ